MTVSIGIGAADGRGTIPPKALYQLADRALYQAKGSGRKRIAMATSSAEPGATNRDARFP
jgi:PleD family two-component response regulator